MSLCVCVYVCRLNVSLEYSTKRSLVYSKGLLKRTEENFFQELILNQASVAPPRRKHTGKVPKVFRKMGVGKVLELRNILSWSH